MADILVSIHGNRLGITAPDENGVCQLLLDGEPIGGDAYVLPAANSSTIGGVKQGVAVANSAATDVAGVNTVLNALLASLRTAGVIASS